MRGKKCVKGASCGDSCISKKKQCRVALRQAAGQVADAATLAIGSIDLDSLFDEPSAPAQNKKPAEVDRAGLLSEWSKRFDAFQKGDRDRASVDSKEIDEKGVPLLQAYMRKGSYFVNGKTYPKVNQLASIEVSPELRGQGLFSSVIREIERKFPDRPIVIEGVSDDSIALAKKNGFSEDTSTVGNWVKLPQS